jgi:flagellar biosynthetic protein FliS
MHAHELNMYKKVYVESAPPVRLLDELLARLLRDIDEAQQQLATRNVVKKVEAINHALAIVTELSAALDPTAAPELCANLGGLYEFVTAKLIESNLNLSSEPLVAAAKVIDTLKQAFVTAGQNR